MGVRVFQMIRLLVLVCIKVSVTGVDLASRRLISDSTSKVNYHKRHAARSVESENSDIFDCIDIYKQPAFDHPALKNHKIQMTPRFEQTTEIEVTVNNSNITATSKLWRKNGSCPTGTVPIRRIRRKDTLSFKLPENYGRKGPSFPNHLKKPNVDDKGDSNFMQANHSYGILLTEGYNYYGAKADIKVWTPNVVYDDEYSASRMALKNGPYYDYESIEAGWMVNPSLYGDRETRIYTYWTADGSKKTGCFDLICPGFVQTSNEIALGGIIQSIPVPGGLPWIMTLEIVKDPYTRNWWVHYQEKIYIGYWPAELFERLPLTAETVQWGGEVYSSRLGHPGHTLTAMGSGEYPDYVSQDSGWTKKMRIKTGSMVLRYPDWVTKYSDDYRCYDVFLLWEYIRDPEFYFGGPGRGWLCT